VDHHGRPVNAVTDQDWQGTGAQPDILTPPDQGLTTACDVAHKHIEDASEGTA
jgi:hypothetical protein